MKDLQSLKRFVPAATAFLLVAVGSLMVLPKGDGAANASDRRPTVVVTSELTAGATRDEVARSVEVRMLEVDARASGALAAIDEIPEGILVSNHVAGQQLLQTSFAANVVEGIGKGYVAVSVRLDAQRWVGPVMATGKVVDVYDIAEASAEPIARKAVVLSAPSTEEFDPRSEAIISLGIPQSALARVLVAANENRVWLVGA